MSRLEQVKEFMLMNGQDIEKEPTPFISQEIRKLRTALISEELEELEEAIRNEDIIEITDALIDLEYVLLGAVHAFGLQNIFDKAFTKVHDNNMSKLCNSYEEAQSTVEHYSSVHNLSTFIEELPNNQFAVKRASDSKLLKSIMYQSVNLTAFFNGKNTNLTQVNH